MLKKRYWLNQARLRNSDIFLASYPRSGNTWMRLLLSDALLQLQGVKTTTGGNIIPDIYKVDIDDWFQNLEQSLPFRLIKTHEPLFFEKQPDDQYRSIYLFRSPEDALASYYYYTLRYPKYQESDQGIDQFCLERVSQWCRHVESYLRLKDKAPQQVIFLSYEKLSLNPLESLQAIMKLLGWERCKSVCKKAVRHQKFNNLKSLSKQEDPEKLGFWEDGGYQNFFRQGTLGNSGLSEKYLIEVEKQAMPLYHQATQLEPVLPFEFKS
ncbi:sulfotransferase [Geitlerinema sp. P-1104]|uniref:sulfotransferase domain-containing protein n=1 Tax=Geitlerinema sp. P-1104 TaxID=2546230 RepID=UPI001476DC55|nr:sulfotransferase domain-containing protein [Geitlerinema sp. P-1104]NMG58237.1 sulfotransferase [Geitlerinema sp. P-1104]